jgi:hypothetical protein
MDRSSLDGWHAERAYPWVWFGGGAAGVGRRLLRGLRLLRGFRRRGAGADVHLAVGLRDGGWSTAPFPSDQNPGLAANRKKTAELVMVTITNSAKSPGATEKLGFLMRRPGIRPI